jgi:surfeit locus 1 family protein
MRFYFRPLLKPTLWTLPFFVTLIWLGAWQIERLHWKLGLIAEVNSNLTAPPIALDRALALGPESAQYHRVALAGTFDNSKEAYVFTTGENGEPVFHVVTPFALAGGGMLLVDRGFIPQTLRDPKTRAAGQLAGPQHIVGVWRIPDAPGAFTPAPDMARRIWYARDIAGIARADGIALAAPVIVEADSTPNPGGWPKGGQTIVNFPNDHLQYAITWFMLAAGLLAVYLAYHRSKGRLGW